jgi:hypothetical protein
VAEDGHEDPAVPDDEDDDQAPSRARHRNGSLTEPVSEPEPEDEVDEWGYESFPASDPPQH